MLFGPFLLISAWPTGDYNRLQDFFILGPAGFFARRFCFFAIHPAGPENFSLHPGRDFFAIFGIFCLTRVSPGGFPQKTGVFGRTFGYWPNSGIQAGQGEELLSLLKRCFGLWAVSGLFWTWRPVFGAGMFFFPQADIFSIFSAFAVCGADS